MPSVASQEQWKSRYRELVHTLETKEREWSALEAALRKAAAKLALAAMGQDDRLDTTLQEVLDAVRTKVSTEQLDASVTSLSRVLQVPAGEIAVARAAVARTAVAAAPAAVSPAPSPAVAAPPAEGPSFATLLRALIEQVARVGPLAGPAAQLARRLADGVADDGWERFVRDLAGMVGRVVGTLQAQRDELETFLEEVTRQLAEFESWTSWHEGAEKSRRDDSLGLERTVEAEILGLNREVEEVPDLAVLKVKVQSRLDSVAGRLRSFREKEAVRHAEAERRNADLRTEVTKLKGKTDELIQLCNEQEQRLMLDALTNVHSRYAYERRLTEEYQRWQRHGQPLTYSIWDIDHFKAVNDTYGHDAGDRLLRMIATILSTHKRAEDFVARMGGEEFVLLLPMTPLDAGLRVAEKLRQLVETTHFHHKGKPERVTISCGLTEFRQGDTPDSVYGRADQALYAAKQQGRNRCVSL